MRWSCSAKVHCSSYCFPAREWHRPPMKWETKERIATTMGVRYLSIIRGLSAIALGATWKALMPAKDSDQRELVLKLHLLVEARHLKGDLEILHFCMQTAIADQESFEQSNCHYCPCCAGQVFWNWIVNTDLMAYDVAFW